MLERSILLSKSELSNIIGAVELFKLNTGQLPEDLSELVENKRQLKGWKQQLDEVPVDAWNNPVIFEKSSENRYGFILKSLGADGQAGGEGANADIIVP